MIVDELILKLQADLGDIKKALAQVEAQGKETGKKTGQGFADAFNAIVGGALAAKVTGFLRSSVTEFNKLEKTLLGLQATAKLTGNSFEALKKSVQTLSSDGVLSIDQASTSMKTLIAQGIQADKAFQLLDAAKKVSSFNNIVGDAGQGVADFVKFLQTGSAELAENMDPSIVKVVKSLGGYAKVSSDATAKQKLINAVIEKGGKLAGDYEKFLNSGAQAQVRFDGASLALSQTLGQKLQPAFTAIINGLTKVVTFFTDLIGSMDSVTVAVLAFSTTGFLAIRSFAKGAALLPGVVGGIGASITAALGSIGLFIAGLSAAVIIVGKLRREWGTSQTRDALNERDALIQQVGALQNVNAKTKELADAKARLNEVNKKLISDYAVILKYLDAENLSLEKKIGLIDKIEQATKNLTADKDLADRTTDELIKRRDERLAFLREGSTLVAKGEITSGEFSKRGAVIGAEVSLLNAEIERRAGGAGKPGGAISGSGPATPEFRFIKARDELRKLDREYENYIRKVGASSPEGQEALTKLGITRGALTNELKQATAEYIEDRTTAALFAEQAAYQKARDNILELANVEKKTKEELQKELQDAEEAHIRKNAQIQAQSFATTMQAANASTTGFASLVRARDAGSGLAGLGGLSSGIGGFSDELKSFGLVGQGLSAAGGIIAGLTSLFGKSDEERAREAEEQKRRDEEAKAILELQANYQKNMLALQESQAKLPFENLQRQLRLIDINAQTARLGGAPEQQVEAQRLAQRQSAINATLSAESGSIAGGALFGGVQGNAGSLTQFLGERAAQSAAIAQFMALMNAAGAGNLSSGQVLELARQARSYAGLIPNEIYAPAIASLSKFEQADAARSFEQRIAAYEGLRATAGNLNALASEVGIDTSRAESLLSVIEQSNQTQLEIATNTKKTAENTSQLLRPDRQRSFIDVGQGFISSLGQRISPSAVGIARSLSQQGLSLPSEIGMASTTSTLAKTLQERMAEAMEMQVRNGARANDLLSGILRATIELYRVMDGNPATVSGFDNAAADAWLADRERRRF